MSRWWVSYHQMHLGRSAQNELTLRSCHQSSPKRGPAFILKLPEEILLRVFEFATNHPNSWDNGCYDCPVLFNYKDIKALSYVCRSFHRIASPLLYHTINFSFGNQFVPPSKRVQRLHRRLETNPSLRRHCRALALTVADITSKPKTKDDFDIANDFASWLTEVHDLSIHGGFERSQYTWNLIRNVVEHMPKVDRLAISREGWGLHLEAIAQNLTFPFLRKLDIYGVSAVGRKSIIGPEVLLLVSSERNVLR
jgi:hypothetical protein